MWNDPTRTLYYQVGIGTGNAKTRRATTTSGGFHRPMTPTREPTPSYRYIRNRPVFRAGPPGSLISPNLAGRDAGGVRRVLTSCSTDERPSTREPVHARRPSTSSTWPIRRQAATCSPAIPFSFYPETEWRDDLELGAHGAVLRGRVRRSACRAAPHRSLLLPADRRRTWADAYITGPNDAADTLNLYDVSGLAHYELYRAIAQAGTPSGAGRHPGAAGRRPEEAARRGDWPRRRRTRSDSASRGARTTRPRMERDCRSRQANTTSSPEPPRTPSMRIVGWRTSSARTPGGFRSSSETAAPSQTAFSTRSRIWPESERRDHRCWPAPLWRDLTVRATKGAITGMVACPANGVDVYAPLQRPRGPVPGRHAVLSRTPNRRST